MDWETFQTAYQKADTKTKEIIDSGVIGECVEAQVASGSVDPSHQSKIVLGISHLILNTISKEDLANHFKEMVVPNAPALIEQIQICITQKDISVPKEQVPDPTPTPDAAPAAVATPLTPAPTLQPTTTATPNPSDSTNPLAAAAELQSQIDAAQPIHTIKRDADIVPETDNTPVHQSSQEHIFGQRPVLGETPSYGDSPKPADPQPATAPDNLPTGPRWDSERSDSTQT